MRPGAPVSWPLQPPSVRTCVCPRGGAPQSTGTQEAGSRRPRARLGQKGRDLRCWPGASSGKDERGVGIPAGTVHQPELRPALGCGGAAGSSGSW